MSSNHATSRNLRFFTKTYGKEIRFLFLFVAIFLVFNFAYYLIDGTSVQYFILARLTAEPTVEIIRFITPDEAVALEGTLITGEQGMFAVVKGCEAAQGFFVLLSGILAFRLRPRDKIMGIVLGALFIYLLNLGRIVGLFYVLKYKGSLFPLAHGYIGQSFLIIMGMMFFVVWVSRSSPGNAQK